MVEGLSDVAVVRRIVSDHGLVVCAEHGLKGKPYIDAKLPAFNAAAKYGRWIVVRDLDHDADCPAAFLAKHLPNCSPGMVFRIAVRAIEAWLLADSEGFCQFFGVQTHHVSGTPEYLDDPKAELVRIAAKSRFRAIRADIVPAPGTSAQVGPGYVARIAEFAEGRWSWRRAAERSESLRRCVDRVAALT